MEGLIFCLPLQSVLTPVIIALITIGGNKFGEFRIGDRGFCDRKGFYVNFVSKLFIVEHEGCIGFRTEPESAVGYIDEPGIRTG